MDIRSSILEGDREFQIMKIDFIHVCTIKKMNYLIPERSVKTLPNLLVF